LATPEAQTRVKKAISLYKFAKRALPSCHKFHISNITELHEAFKNLYGKPSFDFMTEYLRMPYKISWIDYLVDPFDQKEIGPEQSHIRKRGLLTWEDRENPDFPRLLVLIFNYFKGEWILGPVCYTIHLDEREPHDFQVPRNSKATVFVATGGGGRIIPINLFDMDRRDFKKTIEEDTTDLTTLNFFLLLLNCKNIEKHRIKPPEKLNKKRRKNKKPPLFSYYVLRVSQPAKQPKGQGSFAGQLNRIHFCRGHFKEYTAESPLFGKYTGLYWWQPHIRGDKERGMVLKDYEVVT